MIIIISIPTWKHSAFPRFLPPKKQPSTSVASGSCTLHPVDALQRILHDADAGSTGHAWLGFINGLAQMGHVGLDGYST